MKNSKLILSIISALIFLIIIYLLITKVFIPSYYSYLSACDEEKWNITKQEKGLYKAGETKVNLDNKTNQTIVIITYNGNKLVLKQELCHLNQFERGMPITCEKPLTVYFAEVECYLTMYLRDSIWGWLYNEELDNYMC